MEEEQEAEKATEEKDPEGCSPGARVGRPQQIHTGVRRDGAEGRRRRKDGDKFRFCF